MIFINFGPFLLSHPFFFLSFFSSFRLGEEMHISLPPSAYIMKVKLPRLKEEPQSSGSDDGSDGSDGSGGSALARGAELTEVAQQSQVESLVEEPQRFWGAKLDRE